MHARETAQEIVVNEKIMEKEDPAERVIHFSTMSLRYASADAYLPTAAPGCCTSHGGTRRP